MQSAAFREMFQTIHLDQIKEYPSPVVASRSDHLSQVTSSAVNNGEREREAMTKWQKTRLGAVKTVSAT